MFGRLGMYAYMQNCKPAQEAGSMETATRRPTTQAAPYPNEFGMLLRLTGVIAGLVGVAALIISNAG